ncbi:MAG: aminopeptidase N [Pseudohongiellaceae bacterium]
MRHAQAKTVYLKDYRPPAYTIETTELVFDLFEEYATVDSRLVFVRNSRPDDVEADTLVLDGDNLELERLVLNGMELDAAQYRIDADSLTLSGLAGLTGGNTDRFELECRTRIYPHKNTTLEGLYKSRTMFCTQCEAEGFRRITYYLDRPDVMSVFTTTIKADVEKYPVLLSNGNDVEHGECDGDPQRHWIKWHDPFKKPSYLFALVAGKLDRVEDRFVTASGRDVSLRIFVESKDVDKCGHAMDALKRAMAWDEENYGREYDLDVFMIVAVDDFNMGAMENKGLNIFNTSCVLANPRTTVDGAFQRVEGVVAHEYFHNWSGNRVTCRDWFQLSLKEGFTVFRDSEFSADMGSRTVKRVEDVNMLRTVQFAEDSGPMAHSVRPGSYMEISNFYTVTIYEKGAEVVRMISQLLGPEKFRAGTDLYFTRHDGRAVTTEDFVKAMEDASGVDLTRFRNWYEQAGTPVLNVTGNYDREAGEYHLNIEQTCPPTPGQKTKEPFHIPVRMGLLDREGNELPLHSGEDDGGNAEMVLHITQPRQQFVFRHIADKPIPSLLRGFSAPVKLHYEYTRDELYFLMVHDSDGFNRWDAAQQLAVSIIKDLVAAQMRGEPAELPGILEQAYSRVLQDALDQPHADKAMLAHLLMLPTEQYLIECFEVADVKAIHSVRRFLADTLGIRLQERFAALYAANVQQGEYKVDARAIAQRTLKNLCLSYLAKSHSHEWLECCGKQLANANNMTDQSAALICLVNSDIAQTSGMTAKALEGFYKQWRDEPLVMDLWFSIQARSQYPGTLDTVRELMRHPAFNIKNPNKVRAVIGAFCAGNPANFHQLSGEGYTFLADQVLQLDRINPQIAARLLTPLTRWKKYAPAYSKLMLDQLKRIKAAGELSPDVFEIVEKSVK